MREAAPPADEQRLVVLPPTARDGVLAHRLLTAAGVATTICTTVEQVCQAIEAGAGAVLLTEEALAPAAFGRLRGVLDRQPPWSDLPLVLMTRDGTNSAVTRQALERLGNVVLLERPVRTATLISAVQMALRGRSRQYENSRLSGRARAAAGGDGAGATSGRGGGGPA